MGKAKLDNFDRRILDILQREGRISNQELADRIGLSASRACAACAASRRRA
jgi:DNA-binding Lrp family transcriptional regulator